MSTEDPTTIVAVMQSMAVGTAGERLVGSSPAFVSMLRQAAGIIEDSDARVLTLGEQGTGRELLARLIHRLGARGTRPFARFACAAFPLSLQDAILFGSERLPPRPAFNARVAHRQRARGCR